jgi:uncharacterized delta-60 repeat protein
MTTPDTAAATTVNTAVVQVRRDLRFGADGFVDVHSGNTRWIRGRFAEIHPLRDGATLVLFENYEQNSSHMIIRITAQGTWDRSYAVNGIADLTTMLGGGSFAAKMVAFSDGAAAVLINHTQLFRITPAGGLDTQFGAGGVVSMQAIAGTGAQISKDVQITSHLNGDITAAYQAQTSRFLQSPCPVITAVRIRATGQLDTSFGTAGIREICRYAFASLEAVIATDSGGALVVLASCEDACGNRVLRLTSTGAFGTGPGYFANGISQKTDFIGEAYHYRSISDDVLTAAFQRSSMLKVRNVVTTGITVTVPVSQTAVEAVLSARGATNPIVERLEVSPAGQIRVTIVWQGTASHVIGRIVLSLLESGEIDTGFGNGGVLDSAPAGYTALQSKLMTTSNAGDIFLMEASTQNPGIHWLRRYSATGVPSRNYSADEEPTFSYRVRTKDAVIRVEEQSDGGLIAQIDSDYGESNIFVRYNANGTRDTRFNPIVLAFRPIDFAVLANDSVVIVDRISPPPTYKLLFYGLAGAPATSSVIITGGDTISQALGGIGTWPTRIDALASGGFEVVHSDRISRFTAEGARDRAFFGTGVRPAGESYTQKLVASDRRYESLESFASFTLRRYAADGQPDTTFGNTGTLTLDNANMIGGIVELADGSVVIHTGMRICSKACTYSDMRIEKYSDTGQPDLTFGNAGRIAVDKEPGRLSLLWPYDKFAHKSVVYDANGLVDQTVRIDPNASDVMYSQFQHTPFYHARGNYAKNLTLRRYAVFTDTLHSTWLPLTER